MTRQLSSRMKIPLKNAKFYRQNSGFIRQFISNKLMHFESAEGMLEIDNAFEDMSERFETRVGKYKVSAAKDTACI